MKYIQAKFILCAMLAVSPMFVSAQAIDWNETDSLVSEKDPMVQVAFRKVAQKEPFGWCFCSQCGRTNEEEL